MFWVRLIELVVMLLALLWSLLVAGYLWIYQYRAAPMLPLESDAESVTLEFNFRPRQRGTNSCSSKIVVEPLDNSESGWTVEDALNPSKLADIFDVIRTRAYEQWDDDVSDAPAGSDQPDDCAYRYWAEERSQSRSWDEHLDVAEQVKEVQNKAVQALAARIRVRITSLRDQLLLLFMLYGVGVSIVTQLIVFAAFSAVPLKRGGGDTGDDD